MSASLPAPGSPDPGFRPRIEAVSEGRAPGPGSVLSLAIQPDGKILVGGIFNRVNGFSRTNLARINPDGSLDRPFQAGVDLGGSIEAIALRADGFIWLGGKFHQVNGQRRRGLARLDAEGGLDSRFELTPELDGEVRSLALQADGKLLFGGRFEAFDLPLRPLKSLARLNVNGTFDDTFSCDLSPTIPGFPQLPLPEVIDILPQAGERVLLAVQGPLAAPGNASLWSVRPDGEREADVFVSYAVSRRDLRAFRYSDGRLLVTDAGDRAGAFPRILRCTSQGEVDAGFQPWYGAGMTAAVILQDGRAVLGGFSSLGPGGPTGQNVVRLRGDGSFDPAFGQGTMIDGGVSVMALQGDGQVLLAGNLAGVNGISLAGLCRLYGGDAEGPAIVVPPTNQTVIAGTSASLRVAAAGTEPLFFQWRNRERNLLNETNAVLTLTNLLANETRLYSVQVSNRVGVVTSTVARLNLLAPTRIIQAPESWVFRPGDSFRFIVYAEGAAPLSYAWYFNGVPIPGATTSEVSVDRARPEDAGEYWAEVAGPGGKVVSEKALFRLRTIQAGDVDPNFAPVDGAQGRVVAVLPLINGNVVIGGTFTNVAGLPRRYVALLKTNGLPDLQFQPQLPADFTLSAVAAFGTEDILVGGRLGREFTARPYVAKLDVTGARRAEAAFPPGTGGSIDTLAVQSGNRVIVGGFFQWPAGPSHTYVNLARLTTELAADFTFPTNLLPNGIISSLVVDGQDRLLVGGSFTELQHQRRSAVARLFNDGQLDLSFDAGAIRNLGGPGAVHRMAVTPENACYLVGSFDQVGGRPARNIARLTASGGRDLEFGFSLGTTEHEEIHALCLQANGWLILGGRFDPYHGGGISAHAIRLFSDGTLDETFGPRLGLSPDIAALAVQADQKLLAGGDFVVQNPDNQRGIARLLVGEPTAPFFFREPADSITLPGADALFWGEAEGSRRLVYAWEKDGQSLPGATNPLILRNLVASNSGAYRLVVSNGYGIARSRAARLRVLEPPVIETMPSNQTVVAGQPIVLQIGAKGSEPLRYEWNRDGVWLRWVTGPTLTLDPVTIQDAAAYNVNVANDLTAVRSATFRLTVVVPPQIISQPTDQILRAGSSGSLAVRADGTPPLGYQWWKHGHPVIGQTNATLGWASVAPDDAGSYQVVITNGWGSVTTSPVRIDILVAPVIVRQPEDRLGSAGGRVEFDAQAVGQPFPYFQWLFGGREIPGANGPTLVLTNLQPAQAGSYSVIAGSLAGTVQSRAALLTVATIPTALTEVRLSVLPDGTFLVEATALDGQYRIEGSADLVHWVLLQELRVTDGMLKFADPDAAGQPWRYYRIGHTP